MFNWPRLWVVLLAVMLVCSSAATAQPDQTDVKQPPADVRAVEVRFLDDSRMRVRLADERIEIATKHGKLSVPTDQVKRLYFAQRLDDETQQQIDRAIAALADPQQSAAARDRLSRFNERAYLALVRAAKGQDPQQVRAVADLLSQIEEADSARLATLRDTDLIETADGKVVGRLTADTLRIDTKQFGVLTMKLADARSLRSQSLIKPEPEPEPDKVLPNPGNLKQYELQINKTFRFQVTGGGGSTWGTDTYTTDSSLAAAAVHAGIVKLGESGVVEVKIVAPPPNFTGTTRNGVTTRNWGQYPGAFEIIKPKPRKNRQ